MIEYLNNMVTYWHWIAFGFILIILEMSMGTFIILWLGLAAVLVGFIDMILDTTFTMELILWMVFSILTTIVWFKWLKGSVRTLSGQSNYRLDTLGTVTKEIHPHGRGKVRFDQPVLGGSIWHATSKSNIEEGSKIRIVEINGQLIEVEKIEAI